MCKNNLIRFSGFITLMAILFASACTLNRESGPVRPRLVLLIAIDAFRFDYLTRFANNFSDRGFKRILSRGANFTDAHINHFRPATAPGHSTMLTGASGKVSGIVDNEWYDRELATKVNCVEDRAAKLLVTRETKSNAGRSPKNLLVTTVGDELKLATNSKAKVIGISYKDRAAILPGGKMADAAYWYDTTTGNFISSTCYMSESPDWVKSFNEAKIPDSYFGKQWQKLLAEEAYALSREDDFPHELDYKGLGVVFPHTMNGGSDNFSMDFYQAFAHTPFADLHLVRFCKAVVENENFGADDVPDLLTVSFSATDRIGHQYGPYSKEQHDQILRLDRIVADLLDYLDSRIGLDNMIVLMTADHGSAPIPEYIAQFGVDAGRIDTSEIPEGGDSVVIPQTVDAALDRALGRGDWVEAFVKPNLYLNYSEIDARRLSRSKVEEIGAQALKQLNGIAAVLTRTQLLTGDFPENEITLRVSNQFFPKRSGDLVIVNQPYYLTSAYKHSINKGADHETCYDYDTHIPFILLGKAFKAGVYHFPVTLNDMAPTLANVLGLSYPSGNQGRVLHECLN